MSEKAPRGQQRRQRRSGQRACTTLLRQLGTARIDGNRHVQIAWCREAECVLQEDLSRRGGEKIGAANDVGDPLRGIVDNDGELIREEAIASPDDEIADVLVEPLALRSINAVGETDR